jgi:hypothetical protein
LKDSPKEDILLNINKIEDVGDFCFKEESNFIALKISKENNETIFSFVNFDFKNNLHFFNVLSNYQFVFYFDNMFNDNNRSKSHSIENSETPIQIEFEMGRKDNSWMKEDRLRCSPLKYESDKKESVMQEESCELCLPEVQRESINGDHDLEEVYEDETINFKLPSILSRNEI